MNIIRINSLRAYCEIYTIHDTSIILSSSLSDISKKLKTYEYFFRCHRSHLINLHCVKSYHVDKGIKLIDGTYVPLSQSLKSIFIERMEHISWLFVG